MNARIWRGLFAVTLTFVAFLLSERSFTRSGSACSTFEVHSKMSSPVATAVAASAGVTCDEVLLDIVRDSLTGKALRTKQINPSTGAYLKPVEYDEAKRDAGSDWCENCVTMAGTFRVQNVRELVRKTIEEGVPGDFLEAGTWRGGNSIMARVVQGCMGQGDKRKVFVSDSFSGLPRASTKVDADAWSHMHYLEVSREVVQDNFKRFSVLDGNVEFIKGYFIHSLPPLRERFLKDGTQLAVLRGDGDMYESYLDVLFNMYDFVPVGGYWICDDCPSIKVADMAVKEFRELHGITSRVFTVAGSRFGTYWRKEAGEPKVNYEWYLTWNATRKPR